MDKQQDKYTMDPGLVKFISAKGKKILVKNDFWTKTNKKNA